MLGRPFQLVGVLSALLATGCFSSRPSARDTFAALGTRNATQQPARVVDHNLFIKMTRKRAAAAWEEVRRGSCPGATSTYYARGFEDGFVDYVEAGGTGEAPFLPPFSYRRAWIKDGKGATAIEDWYAGFRHGATVARSSGLREQYLIPLPGSINAPTLASAALDSQSGASLSTSDLPVVIPGPPSNGRPMPPPVPLQTVGPQPSSGPTVRRQAVESPLSQMGGVTGEIR